MFVREDIRLKASFDIALTGLVGLSRGDRLLDESRAAYGDGVSGTTRVGPPHSGWPGVSKVVNIEVGDLVTHAASASLPLRWEASGPGSGLFPALDADITLTADGEHTTMLTLTGVYRPPLGSLGAMLDRAFLSRVATATVKDFLGRLAKAIAEPSADAQQQGMSVECC